MSATAIAGDTLTRIARLNPAINAFTAILKERALAKAQAIDQTRAQGGPLGPLAGVPFAAKNLFDIAGLPTLAGSKINRERAPATRDATAVRRLEAADAVLVGALNMGEYAYDFTGENVHDGDCRNPHDLSRMSGGSSSGAAAAVAGGLVPLSLGSDTNGSIRVPSSFCGIFGLKPTYGRLSRAGTFPFVASLDHVGPLARCARDLALAYDAMQGGDTDDAVCADRPVEMVTPVLDTGAAGLRIALAGGHFRAGVFPEVRTAIARVAAALGIKAEIELPEARRARAAAYVITASEGAALHLDRLRQRARQQQRQPSRQEDRDDAGQNAPVTDRGSGRCECGGGLALGFGNARHQKNLDLILRPRCWRLQRHVAGCVLLDRGSEAMAEVVPAVHLDWHESHHTLSDEQFSGRAWI